MSPEEASLSNNGNFRVPTQESSSSTVDMAAGISQLEAYANGSVNSERTSDEHFARWEEELAGPEFVLGYDPIDPNSPLYNPEKPAVQHGDIPVAEHTQAVASPEDQIREIFETMQLPDIARSLADTGAFVVHVRRNTIQESQR